MSVLKEYEEFHKSQNWCTECHGKGFKYVSKPYKRYGKWYNDCHNKIKCKKCNGSGEYIN